MSNVYYFQRYSQKENWLTNSTLLLLSRLQHFSLAKFQEALRNVLGADNELRVGFHVSQQIKGKSRIADGLLEQQGYKVVVEAKLHDNFDPDQLKGHLDHFIDYPGHGILLGLSKHQLNKDTETEMSEFVSQWAEKNKVTVSFRAISHLSLINCIDQTLNSSDLEMKEILDDYMDLCQEEGMIDKKQETMLVVTSGISLNENIRYKIYYDPVERNHNLPFKYIGLYADKAIKGIGIVDKQVACWYDENENKLKPYEGYPEFQLSEEDNNKIIEVINSTTYYNIKYGSKFFLLKESEECNLPYSPIRAKKYEFLSEWMPGYKSVMSVKEIIDQKIKDLHK